MRRMAGMVADEKNRVAQAWRAQEMNPAQAAHASPGLTRSSEQRAFDEEALRKYGSPHLRQVDKQTADIARQQQAAFGNTLGATPGEALPTEQEVREQFSGGKLIMTPYGFALGGGTPNRATAGVPGASRATPGVSLGAAPVGTGGGAPVYSVPGSFSQQRTAQALMSIPGRNSVAQTLMQGARERNAALGRSPLSAKDAGSVANGRRKVNPWEEIKKVGKMAVPQGPVTFVDRTPVKREPWDWLGSLKRSWSVRP